MSQNYSYGYGQYQPYGYSQQPVSYGSANQYDGAARGTGYNYQTGYSAQGYNQSSVQAKLIQQAQPTSPQSTQYHTSNAGGSSQTQQSPVQQPPVGYYGGYRSQSSSYQSSNSLATNNSYGNSGGTAQATPAAVQYPAYQQQSGYSSGYKTKDTSSSHSGGGYGGSYGQYTPQQQQVIQGYMQSRQGYSSKPPKKAYHAPAANDTVFYCDTCKVSCVTAATYKTHLEGKVHKKKAAGPAPVPTGTAVFKCDLCDITCTGKDAYEAHMRGSKHMKVLALHKKLGKPIPQVKAPEIHPPSTPTTAASKQQAVHHTGGLPPVSFVGGHALSTTGPKMAGGGAEDFKQLADQDDSTGGVKAEPTAAAAGGDNTAVAGDDADDAEPVGEHLVVAVQKDPKFPYASFKCTMCDCYFNDEYAKKAHVKGRRHRLNFKKQYQPDLKVQPTKSQKKDLEKKRKMYEQRVARGKTGGGQGPQGGGAKASVDLNELRRQEQAELAKLRGQPPVPPPAAPIIEEPMTYEQEYYRGGWGEPYPPPPPPMAPPHPGQAPPPRNPHDDKLVLNKHSIIFPQEAEMEAVKSVTECITKALKGVSDDLLNEKIKGSEQSEKAESQRDLKGAMPVGPYALNLQLRGEHRSELVLMCAEKPTVSSLHMVADRLQKKLESPSEHANTYRVTERPDVAGLLVTSKVGDCTVEVMITLTSASMRDGTTSPEVLLADQEAGVLDRSCCLNALAALRHAKWFQALADGLPSCVIILRVLRDICNRVPAWAVLNEWVLELLVQKCVVSASPDFTKPGDVFRRVMECVASGVFLPGGTSLLDPCEKDAVDAAKNLTPQERVNLTLSAQHALRLIAYEKLHLVLGVDPLPEWSTQGAKREWSEDVCDTQAKRVKTEPDTQEIPAITESETQSKLNTTENDVV